MKDILLALFAIGIVNSAVAATCEDRAAACMKSNGKQDVCHGT